MYGCMDVWMYVRQMPLVPSSVSYSVRQPAHQARQPASIASTAPKHRSKQQRAVVGRWMADLTWSGRWVTVCLSGCGCGCVSLSLCVCASNVCRTPTLRHVWANTTRAVPLKKWIGAARVDGSACDNTRLSDCQLVVTSPWADACALPNLKAVVVLPREGTVVT